MKKRITSVVLALCLLLPMLPITALAEDINSGPCGADGDNVTWSLDRDTGVLTISGKGAMQDYEWDDNHWKHENVFYFTSVVIEKGVTRIGNYAFCNRTSLTSVTISDSVESIGDDAFYLCRKLDSVTIPGSVTSIGPGAFADTGIASFQVDGSNTGYLSDNGVLFTQDQKTLVAYPCMKADTYNIPGGVTAIGASAFKGCTNLTGVTIPDSVTSIGDSAFYWCLNLTRVNIPNGVSCIGNNTFEQCQRLTSIEIPSSVKSIGDRAFANSGLTSLDISFGMESIGMQAFFGCYGLTSLTIPDSVTSIGDGAFSYCADLTSVRIPKGLTSIEDRVFFECTGLTSVEIPDSVTSIKGQAFYRCTSLTEVTIPDGVTDIGWEAFYECASLTEVTIPNGVTEIGWDAFFHCENLTSVTIPDSVRTIGQGVFKACDKLRDVYYGGSKAEWDNIYKYDYDWEYDYPNVTIHYSCTVTFDLNYDGATDAPDEQTVYSDNKVEEPDPAPTREDYTFGGWYKEAKCENEWNFETAVTEDITLYAKWTENKPTEPTGYTVTFNANGGTVNPASAQTDDSGKLQIELPVPTYDGYKFIGWFTSLEESAQEVKKDHVFTEDTTIHAKWEKEETPPEETKYTVTFNLNYTGATGAPEKQTVTDGVKVTEPDPAPTREGYKLDGWYKEAACTNAWNFETDTVTADITLYAKWTENKPTEYTVTFDSQGGSAVASKTVTSGGTVTKPADPTRSGYTFGGWYKEADCKNAWDFSTKITANTTLYAKWEKEETPPEETKYTVTFDLNYTDATGAPDKQTVASGGKVTKPDPAPTREGYKLDGWYKEAACTNAWNFETDTVTTNTTLYAKWTEEETPPEETKYTVTFDLNYTGAAGAPDEQTVTSGGTVEKPADPTRSGYTFGGWYKEQACTSAWNFETDTVSADITLYAKWEEDNSGTITSPETRYRIYTDYYTTGGRVYTSHSSATEGTRVTIEVSPRSGYELEGLVVFNVNTGRELSLTRRYYDVYTFIMPDSPVGVAVSFFGQDADSVSWYTPDIFPVSYNNAGGKTVKWYYSDGQIRHVTDSLVSSGTPLTRDMLISILYNMDPNSTGEPLFWATNQKVMPDIYQSGLWGTDKNITREQTAMLLYNYARHMGYDLSPRVDLTGCSDYDGMRPIARTAMSWAQATGLFRRNLLNMISPGSTLTCGEANTILSRFVSTVARTR